MADWNRYKITNAGLALIAEAEAQGLALTFTNLKTSSHDYSSTTLETLTALEDIEQTFVLSEKNNEDSKVKLTANLNNISLLTGYTFNTYGLYANIGGTDVLMFVATCNNPDEVPSSSASAWQTIINSYLTISNDVNVTINVDLSANATQQYVQNYVKNKLESVATITIPASTGSNYTTLQDKDSTNYYYIDINVAGMTADYVGTNALTPKMINPSDTTNFSILEWEELRDTYFAMIMAMWSYNGYVRVFMYELPDTDFQVQLYGV